ncbi:hypothetical protein L3Q82_014259 [Scortum barcoo]|uniref:Uncharacterized protein n=1 Tax=Scortum barcoo TaxID=214431 RepID=A0ACB8VWQ2_9TELE|nr:hypothetical protein L3Q82_014259 [Scortum barcoo]
MTLDENDVYYADFKKGLLVWDSRLPTSVHVPHAYSYEVHYRSTCKYELNRWKPDKSASTKTKEAPEIIVYPRDEVKKEEENTLICFISHFFPPTVNIKWTKNDVEVSVEDPFIKCLPNSDGTFYVFSKLNFVPSEGDIYGCTVEHDALKEPKTMFWGENKEA